MYLNETKLIGFLGQDAEAKSSQNSKELVRFDVATKASWKNRDSGEYDSRTEWHRIVAWGNLTKFAQTLKKREHVYVSGELRYREYEKAVDEGKNTVTMPVAEIHAAEIRRLDPQPTLRPCDFAPTGLTPRRIRFTWAVGPNRTEELLTY